MPIVDFQQHNIDRVVQRWRAGLHAFFLVEVERRPSPEWFLGFRYHQQTPNRNYVGINRPPHHTESTEVGPGDGVWSGAEIRDAGAEQRPHRR